MGIDVETGIPQYIELGRSLACLLNHADDCPTDFRLHWAGLTQGPRPCAVAQTQAEAIADEGAIVVLDKAYDEDEGITRVGAAWGRPRPELRHYVVTRGLVRAVYLFKKGDGLYVKHPRSMGDFKFDILWNGSKLTMREIHRAASMRELQQAQQIAQATLE